VSKLILGLAYKSSGLFWALEVDCLF
jgi:hypothetical protein